MTPRRALIALAVLLLVPAVGAPAAEAAKRKPCKRAKTHTVAKNRFARVFERQGRSNASYDTRLYGCLLSRNRAVPLEDALDFDTLVYGYDDVTLRRRFVAWSYERSDDSCKADCPPYYDPTTNEVAIRDLRRRRTRRVSTATAPGIILVSRRGALVWTEQDGEDTVDAHLRNSKGHRVVAHGLADTTKFSIAGGRLVWRQGGRRHSVRVGHY
jgi:hypothetical protein